jgi:hypothetical protein
VAEADNRAEDGHAGGGEVGMPAGGVSLGAIDVCGVVLLSVWGGEEPGKKKNLREHAKGGRGRGGSLGLSGGRHGGD